MESKFRSSPVIESFVSQRLEDRKKEKEKLQKEKESSEESRPNAKKNYGAFKSGPPIKKNSDSKGLEASINREPEKRKEVPSHLKGKPLPYVDVPPLKPTLKSAVSDPITSEQANKGPSYKSRAPVEVGVDIEKLVETVLDLEINVPLRSLAGVSTAIQKEIKKQVTKARLPVEATAQVILQGDSDSPKIRVESLPIAAYMVMTEVSDDLPEGCLVADDPVLQYLMANKEGQADDLIVAKPSEPLRAIYMKVNRLAQEECILDEGSMIVSMAKAAAVLSGLTWDPSIRINMESASNHVERTLGLARNVPFSVAGVTAYLQVHILEDPPYRVLLGRPFHSLMTSTVENRADGSSELLLTDPNSRNVATVPTYRRGMGPEELQKQQYQAF